MCGIIGLFLGQASDLGSKQQYDLIESLFLESEIRGQESSGIAIKDFEKQHITVFRKSCKAHQFIKLDEVVKMVRTAIRKKSNGFSLLGHTRIATNGSLASDNQPIIKEGAVGVHNGIICNVESLWKQHTDLNRKQEIDTELLLALLKRRLDENNGRNIEKLCRQTFSEIEGTASFGMMFDNYNVVLFGTNCGSLYYVKGNGWMAIASESHILHHALQHSHIGLLDQVKKLQPGNFGLWSESKSSLQIFSEESEIQQQIDTESRIFDIDDVSKDIPVPEFHNKISDQELKSLLWYEAKKLRDIKRCTHCILPATHPYIEFDDQGVCNFCRQYDLRKHRPASNAEEMQRIAASIKSTYSNQGDNCIMMLSGGRDSCYALHLLVKNYGLKPICFSYDWGMLTDLGRRNQVRMCAKLGLEHIIVSADIGMKRRNIRQNLEAFINKPHLGIIGLLMAGDKAVHYFAAKLAKEKNLPLFGGVCPLEWTYFKEGFAEVRPSFQISRRQRQLSLIKFFGREYVRNPKLINASMLDTMKAFKYYYMESLKVTNVFKYHPWDEDTINNTLINEYNWELAPDTTTTWRIGDGTAALYNYIYTTVAGFTENDCFRSNQILEGVISREEALEKAILENKPRAESLRWYCDIIGIDLKKFVETVNAMPRLY